MCFFYIVNNTGGALRCRPGPIKPAARLKLKKEIRLVRTKVANGWRLQMSGLDGLEPAPFIREVHPSRCMVAGLGPAANLTIHASRFQARLQGGAQQKMVIRMPALRPKAFLK
jgi:hypothetical protein